MNRRPAWDIFCKVIDNFGDIGVCWRLAVDLCSRGHHVRLWVDDASALAWMAPGGATDVEVLPWASSLRPDAQLQAYPCAGLVEAFGCDIPEAFLAMLAATSPGAAPPFWVNLEYLSAEDYVERSHGMPSPVLRGPCSGWTKWFYYPGFTQRTGGLLREPGLALRHAQFDPAAWLASQGLTTRKEEKLVSLFCYEPPALAALFSEWSLQGLEGAPVHVLVAAGRGARAAQVALQSLGLTATTANDRLRVTFLPWLSQLDFDHLLWTCDLNFVRGEDSLVRAIWAGKPWVWQIYPQDDAAHHVKLEALMQRLALPAPLQDLHRLWNSGQQPAGPIPVLQLAYLQESARDLSASLWTQGDLVGQLLQFAAKNR
ncbi:MAG: elongation factor P maturation arginine rhamnosyltransferase EarP [Pseudomonadota bacterium]